jgi:hypothetical protein
MAGIKNVASSVMLRTKKLAAMSAPILSENHKHNYKKAFNIHMLSHENNYYYMLF